MGHHFHLHPLIVHFPIALFITALGSEILSLISKKDNLHKVAWWNYLFGILTAALAILVAWWDNEVVKHPVFYTHKNLAYWTFWFALGSLPVLALIKKKTKSVFRILFIIFLIIVVTLVSFTGYYGGRLVYEYGIGVQE